MFYIQHYKITANLLEKLKLLKIKFLKIFKTANSCIMLKNKSILLYVRMIVNKNNQNIKGRIGLVVKVSASQPRDHGYEP
jgi:hypothetical protein